MTTKLFDAHGQPLPASPAEVLQSIDDALAPEAASPPALLPFLTMARWALLRMIDAQRRLMHADLEHRDSAAAAEAARAREGRMVDALSRTLMACGGDPVPLRDPDAIAAAAVEAVTSFVEAAGPARGSSPFAVAEGAADILRAYLGRPTANIGLAEIANRNGVAVTLARTAVLAALSGTELGSGLPGACPDLLDAAMPFIDRLSARAEADRAPARATLMALLAGKLPAKEVREAEELRTRLGAAVDFAAAQFAQVDALRQALVDARIGRRVREVMDGVEADFPTIVPPLELAAALRAVSAAVTACSPDPDADDDLDPACD